MSSEHPRPTVFLVGAPRCGTTALASYLDQHPDIFVPYVKEPHYFGGDLTNRRGFPTLASYLELYADAGDRSGVDGSTWYLYSRCAAREIRDFEPDARIVVMVRNPVDMLHSWHSHVVLMGTEPLEDFGEALAAEEERRRGDRLPAGSPRENLLYREIPRYGEQIERYLDVFGADRVKVVVYDDFQRDNRGAVQDVVAFLGLDPDFQPEPAVVNQNAKPRSKLLRTMIEHQPEAVRTAVRTLTPRRLRNRLRHSLRQLNSVPTTRPRMDGELRAALVEELSPEVDRLSRLLGRDLSHWNVP